MTAANTSPRKAMTVAATTKTLFKALAHRDNLLLSRLDPAVADLFLSDFERFLEQLSHNENS
jgi:hypothetical protein